MGLGEWRWVFGVMCVDLVVVCGDCVWVVFIMFVFMMFMILFYCLSS